LPKIYSMAGHLTNRYAGRMFADDEAGRRFVKTVAYVGSIMTHYRNQHANFATSTPWPFPCTAGETTAVIDYNGDVRACELRDKFATLSDFDFNFNELWSSRERQSEVASIDGGAACWCTHVCFIHDSMRHSRRALLYEVPKNYLNRADWAVRS
jgi:radical SAM protein with 4Fe4S-binding SPASM domain